MQQKTIALKAQAVGFLKACGPAGATAAEVGAVVGKDADTAGSMLRQYAKVKGIKASVEVWMSKQGGRSMPPHFFASKEWRDAYDSGAMDMAEVRKQAAQAIADLRQRIELQSATATALRVAVAEGKAEYAKANERRARDRERSAVKTRDAKIERLEAEIAELKRQIKLQPAPVEGVVIRHPKATSFAKQEARITGDTKVTIAPTPRGRFDPAPGHVGQFSQEWREVRA